MIFGGGQRRADDCHAMVEGHGLELFFEVSATTLGRKKVIPLTVQVCLPGLKTA